MTTRDERLQALEDAITEWADAEEQRLEDEVEFLQSVFDGRTNGGRLADYVAEEVSALVDDEINAYLIA